jgi:hypothetical protein
MQALQDIPLASGGIPDALPLLAGLPENGLPDQPFPHGPFLVEPDGALTANRVPALRFAWRGHRCEARIIGRQVELSAGAGRVPYTAERPADRPGALAAIGALPAELPPGWRLRVLPDHRLRLETALPLAAPTTATTLVGAMVCFVLALDAYLDRLESAGVAAGTAADASGGSAKT